MKEYTKWNPALLTRIIKDVDIGPTWQLLEKPVSCSDDIILFCLHNPDKWPEWLLVIVITDLLGIEIHVAQRSDRDPKTALMRIPIALPYIHASTLCSMPIVSGDAVDPRHATIHMSPAILWNVLCSRSAITATDSVDDRHTIAINATSAPLGNTAIGFDGRKAALFDLFGWSWAAKYLSSWHTAESPIYMQIRPLLGGFLCSSSLGGNAAEVPMDKMMPHVEAFIPIDYCLGENPAVFVSQYVKTKDNTLKVVNCFYERLERRNEQ